MATIIAWIVVVALLIYLTFILSNGGECSMSPEFILGLAIGLVAGCAVAISGLIHGYITAIRAHIEPVVKADK